MPRVIRRFKVNKTFNEWLMNVFNKRYFRALYVNPSMEYQYMAVVGEKEVDVDDSFMVKNAVYYRDKNMDWGIIPGMGKTPVYVEGISDPIAHPLFDVQVECIKDVYETTEDGQLIAYDSVSHNIPLIRVPYMNAKKHGERRDVKIIRELKESSTSRLEELRPLLYVAIGLMALVAARLFEVI